MDKLLFKLVESVWGRNLIYTMLLVFCAAIYLLASENSRLNESRNTSEAACRSELLQMAARHGIQMDALRMEQIATLERILSEQKKANERRWGRSKNSLK